jgi:hypothetical protein
MDSTASDGLLAQILLIVQEVQVSIANFETRLNEAKVAIESLNTRIDGVIESGFPRGDLKGHKSWHEKKDLPAWKRAILNLILK